jgi:hypothetical protein
MLTTDQVQYANDVLDWFNARMTRVNEVDQWQEQGEIGPTLVTVNRRRDLLHTLDSLLVEVHAMQPKCGCGKCGH